MKRILVLCTVLFAACDVGTVLTHAAGGDGGGGGGDDDGSGCGTAAVVPGGSHVHAAGGTSNAGMGCLSAAGCHNSAQSPGGPAYSIAGTIYAADMSTPKPGATVFVTVAGTTKKIISDMDGNFYMDEALFAGPSNTAAGNTRAAVCPAATPTYSTMASTLVGGGGNCNSTSCHAVGGQGPIYLP